MICEEADDNEATMLVHELSELSMLVHELSELSMHVHELSDRRSQ